MAGPADTTLTRSTPAAFFGGGVIGTLGGLIGLGGAEFRLPLLISLFGFPGLEAVILHKAMSLVVVTTALPFRTAAVPFADVLAHWPIIVNLLAGSLVGAWFGAGWATRLRSETLYPVIAIMLVVIAVVLMIGHEASAGQPLVTGGLQIVAGIIAGFIIGIVAALLGVAGGELLIPTWFCCSARTSSLLGACRLQQACRPYWLGLHATVRTRVSRPSAATAPSCC